MWTQDEAGPFQTVPYPGGSGQPIGQPRRQPHEYLRPGTAKLLTLLHPMSGEVRVKGVTHCTNAVLHPWLQEALSAILATLPESAGVFTDEECRAQWAEWQEGLTVRVSLPADPPPLRMLRVRDNLVGHKTPAFVVWLFAQGIMPLYTPLGGSWLNPAQRAPAESVQRILTRRALHGQHPTQPPQIIDGLEATARGWNRHPTPFVWGGRRAARRARARAHAAGGSGAQATRPIRRRETLTEQWRCS